MGAPSSGLLGGEYANRKMQDTVRVSAFPLLKDNCPEVAIPDLKFLWPKRETACEPFILDICGHCCSRAVTVHMKGHGCASVCCVLLFESWQSAVIYIGGRREDVPECVVMAGITISVLYTGYLL